jgi:hypothetical protein
MSADLRGFSYALEPVRRQREWKLDAAQARLGTLQRQVARSEAERAAIEEECRIQAGQVSRAWMARPDPAAQVRLLAFLSALHQRRVDAEREIADLKTQLDEARRDCASRQQDLEVLNLHRVETVRAYGAEQFRKSSVQADQDWGARHSDGTRSGEHS